MQQIIEDVAKVHIGSICTAVKENLEDTMDDLNFMFEKTALPRPVELGEHTASLVRTKALWTLLKLNLFFIQDHPHAMPRKLHLPVRNAHRKQLKRNQGNCREQQAGSKLVRFLETEIPQTLLADLKSWNSWSLARQENVRAALA